MTTYYLCSSLVIPTSFVVPFPTCLFGREREREQLHAEDNPLILLWWKHPPLSDREQFYTTDALFSSSLQWQQPHLLCPSERTHNMAEREIDFMLKLPFWLGENCHPLYEIFREKPPLLTTILFAVVTTAQHNLQLLPQRRDDDGLIPWPLGLAWLTERDQSHDEDTLLSWLRWQHTPF